MSQSDILQLQPMKNSASWIQSISPRKFITIPSHDSHLNLLTQARAHLYNCDPRFENLFEQFECKIFSSEGLTSPVDLFKSLVTGIISQQVSGAAARAISGRFIALFNLPSEEFPTSEIVSTMPLDSLRLVGLSQRKAEYVHGLSTKFTDGTLTPESLIELSDEEVVSALMPIRGLGR